MTAATALRTDSRPYSVPQSNLINKLTGERDVPVAGRSHAEAELIARYEDILGQPAVYDPETCRFVSVTEARHVIDWLFTLPRKAQVATTEPLTPGVYELPTGEIYVVKPTRDGQRLYAKRMVEHHGDRLVESGDHRHDIEFEYERGGIARIRPEHRMSVTRAKELTIRYGKCINCGRKLRNGVSVERGIGPVYIKSFRA